MTTAIITGIVTLLGIISTIVAFRFNPRQRLYDDIDKIFIEEDKLRHERDVALKKNDSDTLTSTLALLIALRQRKLELMRRLKVN